MSHRTGGCWILPGLVTVQVLNEVYEVDAPRTRLWAILPISTFLLKTGNYFVDKMLPHIKRQMWGALQRPLANQFEEEHYLWVMLQETPEKTVPLKALFYECLQKCDLSLQCNLAHVFQPIFLPTYGLTLCWLEESTSLIICQPPADRFSQVEIEVFNFLFFMVSCPCILPSWNFRSLNSKASYMDAQSSKCWCAKGTVMCDGQIEDSVSLVMCFSLACGS